MIRFLSASLYWRFERGSWQWDLCCLFHIAIIFTVPRDFLECYTRHPLTPDQIQSILASALGL